MRQVRWLSQTCWRCLLPRPATSAEGYSKPDPTKPMSGWRSAWRSLTRAVNCPACGKLQNPSTICGNPKCGADVSKVKSSTAGLRFHDLRHHAITELAESQASDRTVMAIAGHVSQRMLAHYSHVLQSVARSSGHYANPYQAPRPLPCITRWPF